MSLESIKSKFVNKDARIKFEPPSGFKSESNNRTNRQEQIEERRTIRQVSVINIIYRSLRPDLVKVGRCKRELSNEL